MDELKIHIYERIKHLQGIIRVQTAFDIMKKKYNFTLEKNAFGLQKEFIKLFVDGNKFTITKGYTGKFEVSMYYEERKIVGISTIEATKEGVVKGEFGIKLKDPSNPDWEHYVEDVAVNKCFAEFKHISSLCIFVAAVIGVQVLTLSDQASSGCLLSVSIPFNIFISILRLMVGKPSIYESIKFRPLFPDVLHKKISIVQNYTYGELIKSDVSWAKNIKLIDLINAYINKIPIAGITNIEMCHVIQQISNILNTDIYYGNSSKYIRIIHEKDIEDMIQFLKECL